LVGRLGLEVSMSEVPYVRHPATTAVMKLARLVEHAGSVTAFARDCGVQANSIRLHLAGATCVKASTIRRYQPYGISAQDWFDIAPADETSCAAVAPEDRASCGTNSVAGTAE
jgi:hypothetical protein